MNYLPTPGWTAIYSREKEKGAAGLMLTQGTQFSNLVEAKDDRKQVNSP